MGYECPRCSVDLKNPGSVKIIPIECFTEASVVDLRTVYPDDIERDVLLIRAEKIWWSGIDHRECAYCGEHLDSYFATLGVEDFDSDLEPYR